MAGLLDIWGDSPNSQAEMAMIAGLLSGKGNFGGILGRSLAGGQEAYSQGIQSGEMSQLRQAQIAKAMAEAERMRRGTDQIGKINLPQVTPASLAKFLKSNNPADLEIAPTSETRTFDAYRALPPDMQAAQYDFKHDPYKVADVAGVPSIVRAGPGMFAGGRLPGSAATPTVAPVSSLSAEVSAAAAKARAKAAATEEGQIAGNVSGETGIRRPQQARTALGTLEEADQLLNVATGSLVGKGRDIALGAVGISLPPDQAAARLKVIQGTLLGQMPKFKGADSDKDVRNYIEAVGQIGDDTVPNERRRAALETVRSLFNKAANQGNEPTPNMPRVGEVRRGYRFKGGNPADQASWEKVQ